MSNIFHIAAGARDRNSSARRAKLDVVTAAMLTGGASGVWDIARAYRSRAARDERYARAPAPQVAADSGDTHAEAA